MQNCLSPQRAISLHREVWPKNNTNLLFFHKQSTYEISEPQHIWCLRYDTSYKMWRMVWSDAFSNLSEILCMSLLSASFMKIQQKWSYTDHKGDYGRFFFFFFFFFFFYNQGDVILLSPVPSDSLSNFSEILCMS